jgi:GTP-binding protein
MVVLHLPRLLSFSLSPSFSRQAYSISKRTLNTLLHPPKSTLTTSEPNLVISTNITPKPQTKTLSLENIFIPPDTHVTDNARILNGSNILLSKYATDAQIIQADFVKSSVRFEDCPSDGLPEFALVGRSNVGKSSLLNSIVRRKKLALTSKKPGWSFVLLQFHFSNL